VGRKISTEVSPLSLRARTVSDEVDVFWTRCTFVAQFWIGERRPTADEETNARWHGGSSEADACTAVDEGPRLGNESTKDAVKHDARVSSPSLQTVVICS